LNRNGDDMPRSLVHRLLWFVALWSIGVVSVALVAYGLRWWLF